jgi:hypothetical protein
LVRAILLATLTLLVAASAAGAAPPWSAPRDASPPAGFLTAPGLVAGPGGDALLSWNTGEPARGHLSTLRADGTIVPHGTLGGEVVAKPLLRGGNRTVILARTRRVTKRFGTVDQLTVRFGTTTSPRGRVRRVGATHAVFGEDQGPALAVRDGEVAVAWVEKVGLERHRYRIAFSRGGRAFGKPKTLATTELPTRDSESIALAYSPGRKLVAAYASRRRHPVIVQRTRRPGRGFGGEHVLGDRQPRTTLVADSNRHGSVLVAWGSQDSGEETNRPWVVRAVKRPGVSFGPAVVLDPGGAPAFAPRTLAANVSNDGGYTVAWNNVVGTGGSETFPLRVATAPVTSWGPTTEITPNGVLGGLAVDHGIALLSWTDEPPPTVLPHPPYDVFAAQRSGSFGTFGPPEHVSTPALDDRGPAVPAFVARRPTVLWPVRRSAEDNRLEISSR